ncbi:MAG: hypothetical protein QOE98_2992, partial [Gaiellaceae bacterium]|nr:hypothetical protein [Gaiellaceae bacterium]
LDARVVAVAVVVASLVPGRRVDARGR